MNLTMPQQNFLKSLISNGVCLLKGGVGTGKTFCAVDYTLQMGQKRTTSLKQHPLLDF